MLARQGMQLQCFIQDGDIQMLGDEATVIIELVTRTTAH